MSILIKKKLVGLPVVSIDQIRLAMQPRSYWQRFLGLFCCGPLSTDLSIADLDIAAQLLQRGELVNGTRLIFALMGALPGVDGYQLIVDQFSSYDPMVQIDWDLGPFIRLLEARCAYDQDAVEQLSLTIAYCYFVVHISAYREEAGYTKPLMGDYLGTDSQVHRLGNMKRWLDKAKETVETDSLWAIYYGAKGQYQEMVGCLSVMSGSIMVEQAYVNMRLGLLTKNARLLNDARVSIQNGFITMMHILDSIMARNGDFLGVHIERLLKTADDDPCVEFEKGLICELSEVRGYASLFEGIDDAIVAYTRAIQKSGEQGYPEARLNRARLLLEYQYQKWKDPKFDTMTVLHSEAVMQPNFPKEMIDHRSPFDIALADLELLHLCRNSRVQYRGHVLTVFALVFQAEVLRCGRDVGRANSVVAVFHRKMQAISDQWGMNGLLGSLMGVVVDMEADLKSGVLQRCLPRVMRLDCYFRSFRVAALEYRYGMFFHRLRAPGLKKIKIDEVVRRASLSEPLSSIKELSDEPDSD